MNTSGDEFGFVHHKHHLITDNCLILPNQLMNIISFIFVDLVTLHGGEALLIITVNTLLYFVIFQLLFVQKTGWHKLGSRVIM